MLQQVIRKARVESLVAAEASLPGCIARGRKLRAMVRTRELGVHMRIVEGSPLHDHY